MISKFKIYESSLSSGLRKLERGDIDGSDTKIFKDIVGFDQTYKIKIEQDTYGILKIYFEREDLEDLLNAEEHSIDYVLQKYYNNYNNYDYYVDLSEIGHYVSDDNITLIKKLFNLLDIKEEVDSESIYDLFGAIGDDLVNVDDLTYELSYEFDNAIKHNCKEILEDIPFEINFSNKVGYDFELIFDFDEIDEYMKDKKIDDVKTLNEFIEKLNINEFDLSMIDNPYETNYELDLTEFDKIFKSIIEDLIEILESNDNVEYKDPNQLDLFSDIEPELIKKSNIKNYKYQYDFFGKLDIKNLHYAKRIKGKIYGWFKSYEFQKNYISSEKSNEGRIKRYKFLIIESILNPIIEYEYEHLIAAEKYNL